MNTEGLAEDILSTLQEGPFLTTALAARLGSEQQQVEKVCRSLKREHKLVELSQVDAAILDSLNGNGSLSTSDLADAVEEDPRRIYQRCRRLEQTGFLSSATRQSTRRLFFFPATGAVLNRANYGDVDRLIGELKGIARRHVIPRGAQIPGPIKDAIRTEYRRYIHKLADGVSQREQQQLESFELELMSALSNTTLSDVVGCIGLRPFFAKIKVWVSRVPESLDLSEIAGGGLPGDPIWNGDVIWVLPPGGRGGAVRPH